MKRLIYGFAVFGLLIGLPCSVQAQYDYTTIDVPGGIGTWTRGINDAGQIVGQYGDAGGSAHGFLLDVDGSYTTLDVPGAMDTKAWGINDAGQIVGENGVAGFLLDVDGSYSRLDVPGARSTTAWGINNAGLIVGSYSVAGGLQHGFHAMPNWPWALVHYEPQSREPISTKRRVLS
jgi:uncharacterized membrane protein